MHCQNLLNETADTLRPLAAQKGLALTLDLPAEPVIIASDRRALTQIVINLVNNAIKFTDQGAIRVVAVAAHRATTARVTEFAVQDSGSRHPAGRPGQAVPGVLAARLDLDPPRRRRGPRACTCARTWPTCWAAN